MFVAIGLGQFGFFEGFEGLFRVGIAWHWFWWLDNLLTKWFKI